MLLGLVTPDQRAGRAARRADPAGPRAGAAPGRARSSRARRSTRTCPGAHNLVRLDAADRDRRPGAPAAARIDAALERVGLSRRRGQAVPDLLARHEAAARPRRRAAAAARPARARRADERPRPAGHPRGPHAGARAGRRGPHGAARRRTCWPRSSRSAPRRRHARRPRSSPQGTLQELPALARALGAWSRPRRSRPPRRCCAGWAAGVEPSRTPTAAACAPSCPTRRSRTSRARSCTPTSPVRGIAVVGAGRWRTCSSTLTGEGFDVVG